MKCKYTLHFTSHQLFKLIIRKTDCKTYSFAKQRWHSVADLNQLLILFSFKDEIIRK